MKSFIPLKKSSISLSILALAITSFTIGLSAIVYFQSKYFLSQKITTAVQKAEKLSQFDHEIPIERALRIYSSDLSYAVFDHNCSPVYVTDLKILSSFCENRFTEINWIIIDSELTGRELIIGYSSKFEPQIYWNEGKSIILASLLSYTLFTVGLTFILLKLFVEIPVMRISKDFTSLIETKKFDQEHFQGKTKNLLSPLFAVISRIIEEVSRLNREEEKHLISRQIAHDLRAPLSVLETQILSNTNVSSVETLAINRIKKIAEGLLDEKNKPLLHGDFLDLNKLIDEIIVLYPDLKINLQNHLKTPYQILTISEIELFRIISNLLKNSIEASATQVNIQFLDQASMLEIFIEDNGIGTDAKNITKFLDGQTTKAHGNGMALSFLKKIIQKVGGELEISSSHNEGFHVRFKIPKTCYILIDDDKLIRLNWKNRAESKGLPIFTFETIDEFLATSSTISHHSHIYVDSNLNNDVQGEIDSKRISRLGFQNIYLSTGYSSDQFDLNKIPWIKGIISKAPPF